MNECLPLAEIYSVSVSVPDTSLEHYIPKIEIDYFELNDIM